MIWLGWFYPRFVFSTKWSVFDLCQNFEKITLFEQVARLSFQNRVWCYDYFDKNFLGSTPFSGSGLVPSSTPFSFKINGSYVISSIVLFYFKGELEFSKVIWQDIKLRAQGTSYGLLRKFQKAQDQPVQSKTNPSTPLITRKVRIKNRILTRKSICWIKSAKNCNPVIGDILVRSVGQLYICTFNSMPKSINPPKSYSNIFLVI